MTAGAFRMNTPCGDLPTGMLPVTRIAAAWPSDRSLAIIEELLFKPPATARDLLSLQAYRDLIWLYALGQEVVHQTRSPNDHFILPWADAGQDQPTELSLDRLATIDVAPELTAFGVDFDLTETGGDSHPATEVRLPQFEATAPATGAPDADLAAFDAAMELESRRSH